ncbi:IS66 family insertion sequence element accessory protein TnpB [Petroclostridium sp. X23]|uniref:IS66 family insertion sequence element accessory protein TnpB n=1 Tax=Petroclostridium sp. X23 TaxID=3045146 RepID=UPI0024ADB6E5|nr:IS66 family insertion sequence element accessory protein TnpB [Petroclostridium sp. X23]WHH57923.1 IS66 family insertion sequence element accessory protein TnpB [Petroclostridium sp. X23]WHH58835.1 IS66 family insertion sequence element accessory protein TnpB [Petroclostridium sp. X23]WHH60984.1 IS66 family insertion sequence element accessory protein TnpB [Petroclostridium sp. X23]
MKTQTSLVAEQIRIQKWSEQIKDCQARPAGMKVDTWCEQNGITKAAYYFRLRRVREACLAHAQNNESHFVELPVPTNSKPVHSCPSEKTLASDTVAILHGTNDISIELLSTASTEFISTLIGAIAHVK